MKLPDIKEAERILEEASTLNPGPWTDHSRVAASAAAVIAKHAGMNEDAAYVMGLLHDIGRRFGVTGISHVTDGYNFLMGLGYDDAARICYTHSFFIKNVDSYVGRPFDCDDCELEKLRNYIDNRTFDDYDRLIQLCDSICLPSGVCLQEKRMIDVACRLGINEYSVEKWKKQIELKAYFDRLTGLDIYSLFPDIAHNTFSS